MQRKLGFPVIVLILIWAFLLRSVIWIQLDSPKKDQFTLQENIRIPITIVGDLNLESIDEITRTDGHPQNWPSNFTQALARLEICPSQPNSFTNHIRLSNVLYNISMGSGELRRFWNPTIIPLPHWADNQYLIISMVLLKGAGYRQNVFCLADHDMRCTSEPVSVDLPPTTARKCEGNHSLYADIPGFHDPRLFWTSRGEPLLMVSSQ